MAIVWADGFDHYGSADALALAYPNSQASIIAIGATEFARTGRGCFRSGFNVTGSSRLPVVVPLRNVYGAQFSTFIEQYLTDDGDVPFQGVQFRGADGLPHIMVHFGFDGSVQVWRGNYAALLYRSVAGIMTPRAQQYWSVKVAIANDETGTVEIRLGEGPNETTVILLAGIVTSNGGAATVGIVSLGRYFNNPRVTGNFYYDDFVIWNTDGTSNNDFLNSRRCRTTVMTADDIQQDWASNSGALGYQEISHYPPDAETYYLSSANNGDVSQFSMSNVPTNAIDVAQVYIIIQARKDVAADVQINGTLANADGDVSTTANISLTTETTNYAIPVLLAPDGSRLTAKKFNLASVRITNES